MLGAHNYKRSVHNVIAKNYNLYEKQCDHPHNIFFSTHFICLDNCKKEKVSVS